MCCSLILFVVLFGLKLVNLARLGNENISKKYNLRAIYNAAIEVTKLTTGCLPQPRTEVYGAQAMDVVFAEDGKTCLEVDLLFSLSLN